MWPMVSLVLMTRTATSASIVRAWPSRQFAKFFFWDKSVSKGWDGWTWFAHLQAARAAHEVQHQRASAADPHQERRHHQVSGVWPCRTTDPGRRIIRETGGFPPELRPPAPPTIPLAAGHVLRASSWGAALASGESAISFLPIQNNDL